MILWLHFFRPRSGWYTLETERKTELRAAWEAVGEAAQEAGAESLGEFAVRGQSIHERVQVWQFPTATAIEDHWTRLMAAGYADWRESENVVGVPEIPVEYVPAP